ncbi:MAG: DUF1549 domain-containing protein [Verrucomicrobiales bacterium]
MGVFLGVGVAVMPAWGAVDFDHEVAPILKNRCIECHSAVKKKGGLSLNDRSGLMAGSENGPVVVAGEAAGSRLIELVSSDDPDDRMPPKGERLTEAEVAVLRRWIDEGAAWTEGFAFVRPAYEPPLKPRNPELPPPVAGRNHPIDRLIDAYLASENLPRPEPVDDATFLRRVSLDLTGLLPKAPGVEEFLADRSPGKRMALVEALLADETAYAEHWLTFWNDLLRNDYAGTGYIDGGRRQISAWLYSALRENMPYNQFARELIAPPTDESRGFIGGIKWRGEVSAGQTVEIQFAQSVAQTFLGLNMKCASCHDSFIDRWKLDEAYGLAAVFSERELEIARCDKGTGQIAQAAWIFPELGHIDTQAPAPERLKQLAGLMTHRDNGRFTRTIVNRLWHRLMGRGIVHPVDAMQSEPWHPDLLDFLAEHLVANNYDLKRILAFITSSHAYQSRTVSAASPADDDAAPFAGPRPKRLTAEQFVDAIWQVTGTAPRKMDAPVTRHRKSGEGMAPTAAWVWGDSARDGGVPPSDETLTFRREFVLGGPVALAAAAVTCDNEFRLAVNGSELAHSLNWESVSAIDLTESLRPGANEIVIEAKNAGAGPNAAGLFFEARIKLEDGGDQRVISDGEWVWHTGPPLAGGDWKPVVIVPALGVWTSVVSAQVPGALADGMGTGSRMVRAALMNSDLLMRALGRPNREQIVSMRPNDLTTLEAIDLSNGQILADLLARGAQRLASLPWADGQALVRHVYLSTLSRPPSPQELALLSPTLAPPVAAQAVEDVLWAICMTPEFQFNH